MGGYYFVMQKLSDWLDLRPREAVIVHLVGEPVENLTNRNVTYGTTAEKDRLTFFIAK